MGYIRHHAIIVTSYHGEMIGAAHDRAKALGLTVTDIIKASVNVYHSFLAQTFMAGPDGSKEGWDESDEGDQRRLAFIQWLEEQRYEDGSTPLAWVEVQYGDERHKTLVTAHSDEPDRYQRG